ncbi:hypothetical protein JMJ35_001124 [Cladonia borealis]|uniref:Uncharacterized protein n=1 Tax=Cladonia borealis TaxID=184061 RepID=A0AA39UEF3_9LECA|nr:hypothetical protein JMJ35_001124 [Cladonia borealis]
MPFTYVMIPLHGDVKTPIAPPNFATNIGEIARAACNEMHNNAMLVRTRFMTGADGIDPRGRVGVPNGLIITILKAYTNHHRLMLSAEDFEAAILVQLNSRRMAMGPKSMALVEEGIRTEVKDDPTGLATPILGNLQADVLQAGAPHDIDLRDINILIKWGLRVRMEPSLPRGGNKDMSNNLFHDGGIPEVMLLGTKADWAKLREQFSNLGDGGEDIDLRNFSQAVSRLVTFFETSFENPRADYIRTFWNLMCPRGDQTGWLAVFNYWDAYGDVTEIKYDQDKMMIPTGYLKMDHLSPGYRLQDFRVRRRDGSEILVKHVLGSVGTEYSTSPTGVFDTVQPMRGSLMFAP